MKIIRSLIGIVIAVAVFVGSPLCFGASELLFPRIRFDSARYTGFAIANPSSTDAQVTLTAYALDGKLLQGTGVTNPRTVLISAGKQYSDVDGSIFNGYASNPDFKGWVLARSDRDGLTGFFLMGDVAGKMLDGASLPDKAVDSYFNLLLDPARYFPEISLVNPNGDATQVTLTLAGKDGATVSSRAVTIAANGALQDSIENLFTAAQVAQSTTLQVESKLPVSGFEFVFARDGSDMMGMNAQPVGRKFSALSFPQLAVLGDWFTQVGVFNVSNQLVLVSLAAYKPDGTLYSAPDIQGTNPYRVAIAARGTFSADLATLFGFQGGEVKAGWLKVETAQQAIHGFVAYGTRSSPTLAAVSAQNDPQGNTTAIFSHQANGGGFFTGLAILNSTSLVANVEIMSLTPAGQVLGTSRRVLGPLERISSLVSQLVPQAEGQAGGLVVVRSDQPVFTSELFGTVNGQSLANVPAEQGPAGYNPNPSGTKFNVDPPLAPVQLRARQTFKARVNNAAAAGIRWSVNGKPGGDAEVGLIDSQGIYSAPARLPLQARVTVKAETSDGVQVAGATVDLVQKEAFNSDINFLRSQTYLGTLKKLYVAELAGLSSKSEGGFGRHAASGKVDTVLSEVDAAGKKKGVNTFKGLNVLSAVPYTDSKGTEHLLIAGYDSSRPSDDRTGKIIRFNPVNSQSLDVVSELRQPVAMSVDPASGELLVADQGADAVVTVTKRQLDPAAQTKGGSAGLRPARFVFAASKPAGLVVDRCDGSVYATESEKGRILRFDRKTNQTTVLVSNLQRPARLFGIFRSGLDCPDSFFLLVGEESTPATAKNGRLTLVIPTLKDPVTNQATSFAIADELEHIPDISVIPANNPYVKDGQEAISFGEEHADANDQIFFVPDEEDDYSEDAPDRQRHVFDAFAAFGFVLQDSDGLGGITVRLTSRATGQVVQSVVTDFFGAYQFDTVPPGTYTITPTATTHTFTPANLSVVVEDGDVDAGDFSASPIGGFNLSGALVDSRGRPIAGADVYILDAAENVVRASTGADGKYLRRGLANGTYIVVPIFSDFNFAPEFREVRLNGAAQTADFVSAEKVWSVGGKATSRDGSLPGGAVAVLYDSQDDDLFFALVDAAGNFQFPSIPESSAVRYALAIFKDGFEFLNTQTPPTEVYEFSLTADRQFPFDAQFTGYDIAGKVIDVKGKPIAGALVQYGGVSVTTGADGTFTLSKVKSNLRVTVSKIGFVFTPATFDLDVSRLPNPDRFIFVGAPSP